MAPGKAAAASIKASASASLNQRIDFGGAVRQLRRCRQPDNEWFGAADGVVDLNVIDVNVIAWVQAISIVVGQILGALYAHDLAIRGFEHRSAVRSQQTMLFVMVAYSVCRTLVTVSRPNEAATARRSRRRPARRRDNERCKRHRSQTPQTTTQPTHRDIDPRPHSPCE